MKSGPKTRTHTRKAKKLIQQICEVDKKMKEIFDLSGKMHTIIFAGYYHFWVCWTIKQFFEKQGISVGSIAGRSKTIHLENCSVRIYRKD